MHVESLLLRQLHVLNSACYRSQDGWSGIQRFATIG
jgi:hypothetical protein